MFCKNCGNKLKDTDRFCSKCGSPTAKAENREVLSSSTKRRSRKNLLPAIAALAVCIMIAVVLGIGLGKTASIEFEDFLVERCVREALGKSWDEDISADEAASIRELTISWEKDVTVGMSMLYARGTYIGYVNLADLQYLTGLESLELDFFDIGNDVFEHLDAITNCKNLRELTMPLTFTGHNADNGYMGKGYRYLADIFSELPLLEEVDFGVTVPANLQEFLLSSSTNKEIVFAAGEDFKAYISNKTGWVGGSVRMAKSQGFDRAAGIIGPTELSPDIEDAVIYIDKGGIFDCKDLAACSELKTLVIFTDLYFPQASQDFIQVDNLDSLAQLPYLSSVSFMNASIDLEDLEGFCCLRELYLTCCDIRNVSHLQKLTSLCELSIIKSGEIDKYTVNALSKIWENLPDLHYFHGYLPGLEPEDMDKAFGNINSAKRLETLALSLRSPDELEYMDGETLKTLFLDIADTHTPVDLEKIKFNESLENFYLGSLRTVDFEEFIAAHPNLVAVKATLPWLNDKQEADAVITYCNNMIEAAIQNEKISTLDFYFLLSWLYTSDEAQEIRKAVQWKQLYEHRIYDNAIQLVAFFNDMNIEAYMKEMVMLEKAGSEEKEIEDFGDNEDSGSDPGFGNSEMAYIEIPILSEQVKIAGYSVDDGDCTEEIIQKASEIMPINEGYMGNYTGWCCDDHLSWDGAFPVFYLVRGTGNTCISYKYNENGISLIVNYYDYEVPIKEYPLIESTVPLLMSYEEVLDELHIKELVELTEEEGKPLGDFKISYQFNSQYGPDTWCIICSTDSDVPLSNRNDFEITLSVIHEQSLQMRFLNDQLVGIWVQKYINQKNQNMGF